MKIRPVVAEFFHADRWTDGRLTVAFRNFVKVPRKTANGAVYDVAHRLCLLVLYFQTFFRVVKFLVSTYHLKLQQKDSSATD